MVPAVGYGEDVAGKRGSGTYLIRTETGRWDADGGTSVVLKWELYDEEE